jgi:phosphoglycerate dehydrogenase-like enzyme
MILAFTRGIKQSVLNQERRVWAQLELRKQLVELTGSTMGIIGLGSIGRAVARRADAFDMRVLAIDMFPNSKPDYVDELWGLERLGDLLGQSDYVVVTVPGTAQTKSMIGAEEIARMKRTAMLIGVSRGGVIDEAALVEALKEKRLAYAALDVFEREPLPAESELWGMDNVLVTAHIAGGTQFEGKYTIDILRENLGRFLKGEFPLRNQVDKQLGF